MICVASQDSVQSWCCLGQRIRNSGATLCIAQTQCSFCLSLPQAEIILTWNDFKAEMDSVLSDTLRSSEQERLKAAFWSCAEGPKALQYRTKVGEHQQSGCVWVFSPHQPERCENNPDRCCLNSQRINRHKTVIGSLLCKIRGWTHSRSLEEAHSFTAASSQCEAAVPLEGCNPAACFWPVLSFPLDIFKSYFYMLTPVKEWVQVKCCPLLPGCSWPGSDPQASREQQHRHQQWDKEGGGQSARDSGTSAFNTSTGLCCFKMTVKLWKNFQCLQWRIIITKKITQSPNLFFFKNFF